MTLLGYQSHRAAKVDLDAWVMSH